MKKNSVIFTMLLLLSVVVSCGERQKANKSGEGADSTVVLRNGQLQVIGTQLCNEQGEPFILRESVWVGITFGPVFITSRRYRGWQTTGNAPL